MALTFPIETTPPKDIPQFAGIYSTYGHLIQDLDGMLKYLCYRYDPKSSEVRSAVNRDAKTEMAERLSGWSKPAYEKSEEAGEDDIQSSNPWKFYTEVESRFLRIAWPLEYTFLESTEEAIYNAMDVMRRPIPDVDEETQGKMVLNIQKATQTVNEGIAMYRKMQAQIADMDDNARENMEADIRKARAVRDLSGRKIT